LIQQGLLSARCLKRQCQACLIAAADEFDLKQDWQKIKEEFKNYKLLSNVSNKTIPRGETQEEGVCVDED
jgi:hypothetical protein